MDEDQSGPKLSVRLAGLRWAFDRSDSRHNEAIKAADDARALEHLFDQLTAQLVAAGSDLDFCREQLKASAYREQRLKEEIAGLRAAKPRSAG